MSLIQANSGKGAYAKPSEMLAIYKMIACVSDARAPVLITGESGTGKELIARAIHANGQSYAEPFVAVIFAPGWVSHVHWTII